MIKTLVIHTILALVAVVLVLTVFGARIGPVELAILTVLAVAYVVGMVWRYQRVHAPVG